MDTLNKLLVATSLLLGACGGSGAESSGNTGVSGKADDFNGCQSGRNCIELRSYDVLFTNPVCGTYAYDPAMEDVDGEQTLASRKRPCSTN